MNDTPKPTEWHRRPPGFAGRCPICNAPTNITGEHRVVIPTPARPLARFAILRKSKDMHATPGRGDRGSWWVETFIDAKPRPDGYKMDVSKRRHITDKLKRRIIDANRLLARGFTMNQVADKLGVSLSRLHDCQTRHRELWNMGAMEAAKSAAEILRGLAGTAEVFVNQGKLVRMAAAAEQTAATGPGNSEQTLKGFLERVYLPSRIEVSKHYAAILCSVVARFNAFMGHSVGLNELKEADVCRCLTALRQSSRPVSVNDFRRSLLSVWKAAYDQGLADRPPRLGLVRRLPEEHDPPEAWSAEECNVLFSAAADWPGHIGEIPAGQWWLSLLLSVYWTSCRIGALLRTPTAAYKGGRLLVCKQKNHRSQLYTLPASCCAAIDATNPSGRELLWPLPHGRRFLWTAMRRIVKEAGIAQPPGGRQLFHRLRRTSLSLCAAIDPAIAQRQAGHADYATTLKHYIDPRIAHGRCAADVLPEPIISRANGTPIDARLLDDLPQPAPIGPRAATRRRREVIEYIK